MFSYRKEFEKINRKLNIIMAFVKVDSDALAAVVEEVQNVSDGVQALIDSPDNNLTVDDLSEITGPLDALKEKLAPVQDAPPAPDEPTS